MSYKFLGKVTDHQTTHQIIKQIGEGAHGVVIKAKFIETGEIVALKKVPLRKLEDGLPNTIIREIKALQHVNHQNVLHNTRASSLLFVLDSNSIRLLPNRHNPNSSL